MTTFETTVVDRETVLRLAREAGMETNEGFSESVFYFAKLVAGHSASVEREACAKVCETNHYTIKRSLDSFECAKAIRARGNK